MKKTPKHSVKIVDFDLNRILGKFEFSEDSYGSLCFKAPDLLNILNIILKLIFGLLVLLYSILFILNYFLKKETKMKLKIVSFMNLFLFYSNNIISDYNYIKILVIF